MDAEGLDFLDAGAVGRALIAAAGERLRFGVPFPFSMHAELVQLLDREPRAGSARRRRASTPCHRRRWRRRWRRARSTPSASASPGAASRSRWAWPSWSCRARRSGASRRKRCSRSRRDWAEAHPETASALMRAVWRAGRWVAEPAEYRSPSPRSSAARAISTSRPRSSNARWRAGSSINARGAERRVPGCIEFFGGAATFPWRSQALWIADALAKRTGHDRAQLRAVARACFRQRPLPRFAGADRGRPAGGVGEAGGRSAASQRGRLDAGQADPRAGQFFDGRVFDPESGDLRL